MKNLISFLIYDDVNESYELIPSNARVDFEEQFVPIPKRSVKNLQDEIDKIKKHKVRRMSHPFKDNTQKIC